MAEIHEEQEDAARYGNAPECCPDCRQSATGRCKFHRTLEAQRDEKAWEESDYDYPLSRGD